VFHYVIVSFFSSFFPGFKSEGDAVRKMKIWIAVKDDVTVFREGNVSEGELLGLMFVLFWDL